LIWRHIQSLDDKERNEFLYSGGDWYIDYASDYVIFKEELEEFLKNKVKIKGPSVFEFLLIAIT
jgi:uncharacterized beta-barrel protein YwiB (DUF1934 family)